MNERLLELAEQAGYYFYDLTETHACKTVETDSKDEWSTLERFFELIRADEREACAQVAEEWLGPTKDREIHIAAAIRARGEQS